MESNRKGHCKRVKQYTLDNVFVAEFESAREAGRETGASYKKISAVCNGKQKQTGGYIWRFA